MEFNISWIRSSAERIARACHLFYPRAKSIEALAQLSVCSHEDWEKTPEATLTDVRDGTEVPAIRRQVLATHKRLLFVAEPGMGNSILTHQIEATLKKSYSTVRLLSLKNFKGELPIQLPPRNSGPHSAAWCLLTDLDKVNPALST